MPDPFKLFGRIFVACFKITGYFFVFVIQVIWHLIYQQPDKIGDAFGYLGRETIDTVSEIFK